MDANVTAVIEKRMERTVKALNGNRFDAHLIRSREELLPKLRELIPQGASCSVGGSVTLRELGILDFLAGGDYAYLDRYAEGADTQRVFHDALSCDVYLTSANAITERGELYNMDGRGNRVAAIAYGPEKVIVIAGYNKIVRDIDEARRRNRELAAPANTTRLGSDTPCRYTGACADCKSPDRACCQELVSHWQYIPGRVAVLLLGEQLGY